MSEVKEKRNFPVIIEKDDTGYVVSCPTFEGCYSQGETFEEALVNIQEAISLCLEDEASYDVKENKSVIITQVVV